MLLMFGVFAGMFYKDGSRGYREQNLAYYRAEAFKRAREDFKKESYSSSPEAWKEHSSQQKVPLPEDPKLLPEGTEMPMAWPPALQDYDKMKDSMSAEESKLYDDYRAENGIGADVPDHPFDSQKIFEQWVVFWFCLALTVVTLFVLVRTLCRKIAVDEEALYPSNGGRVPFTELVRMDLRKWENKGVAFLWAAKPGAAERKIRIDGFVYGGFKKEQDEPAETLLKRIRANFQGEVVEMVADDDEPPQAPPSES